MNESRTNFQLIESTPITLANNPAHKMVYNEFDQGDIFKEMEIYTIIGNKAYGVSYIAEGSKFNSYLPTAEKTIDSLQIYRGSS